MALQGGFQVLGASPEVKAPGLRPMDGHRLEPDAWGASVYARPDAAAHATPEVRRLSEDDAEKLAGQARDGRARAVHLRLEPRAAPAAELDAQAPCTPDVVRSAERSCVAPEALEQKEPSPRALLKEPSLKQTALRVFVSPGARALRAASWPDEAAG